MAGASPRETSSSRIKKYRMIISSKGVRQAIIGARNAGESVAKTFVVGQDSNLTEQQVMEPPVGHNFFLLSSCVDSYRKVLLREEKKVSCAALFLGLSCTSKRSNGSIALFVVISLK